MFKPNDFIFHIEEKDLFGDGTYPAIVVYINTKQCWQKNKCLTDYYTEDEKECLKPILNKLHLDECMESTFEISLNEMTIDELKTLLITEGIEYDVEFSNWMSANSEF